MGRPRTVNCKRCGQHIDQVGPLSARKLCEPCSIEAQTAAISEIAYGRGPTFDNYVAGLTAYATRLQNAATSSTQTNAPISPTTSPNSNT